jgi:GxxExxY protein
MTREIMITQDEQDPRTKSIIACAIEVRRELGPGLLERSYCAAMCIAIATAGMTVEREKSFPLFFRGVRLGDFRPDLIVNGEVIVEVKSVAKYDPVFLAQMLTYLRITGLTVGLIMNFNRPLMAEGIKRVAL